MQHLSEKWLRRLNYYYIVFSLYFVGAYAYFTFFAPQEGSQAAFGVGTASAALGLGVLVYNFIFLRFIRKYNVWLAYAISFVIFGLANNAATEIALETMGAYVFMFNNYFLTFAAAALGPVAAFAYMSLVVIVYGMTLAGTIPPTQLGLRGDTLGILLRGFGVLSLIYFFRNKYVSTSDSKQTYIERYFVTNEVVRLLTDSISDGVIIIDKNEIVRSINPAAEALLGEEAKNVVELNYRSVLKLKNANETDVETENEPVLQALKTGKSASKELLLFVPGKQEVFVDITVSVIAEPQTHEIYGAVIILRDVSKKKKEEAARSEFISTASHEMRTPVAAIEGFIELALNEKVSTIDMRARKYLEKARTSTQHLGRLFQDLLVSAKAEDGRLSTHPTVIELGELLEQQVEVSQMAARQKGLQIEFVISSSGQTTKHENLKVIKPLYYAIADQDRIREVATNLIDNAMKYTPAGKITVGVTGNNEVVQFFIRDTGVGIAQEDIPHLFQKFYRVDSSDTRTTGGTGLGLFICRKIIDLYHGRIWAESQKGRGTIFYVNLPRLTSAQAEATKAKLAADQLSAKQAPTP